MSASGGFPPARCVAAVRSRRGASLSPAVLGAALRGGTLSAPVRGRGTAGQLLYSRL